MKQPFKHVELIVTYPGVKSVSRKLKSDYGLAGGMVVVFGFLSDNRAVPDS